jgi:putative lipoprotein
MNKLVLLMTGLAAPSVLAQSAEVDPWFAPEKALHFTAGAVIGGGGYALASLPFESRPARLGIGFGLAVGAGAAKELFDSTGRGHPSWRDFTWTAIGGAVGVCLGYLVDRLLSQDRAPTSPEPAVVLLGPFDFRPETTVDAFRSLRRERR